MLSSENDLTVKSHIQFRAAAVIENSYRYFTVFVSAWYQFWVNYYYLFSMPSCCNEKAISKYFMNHVLHSKSNLSILKANKLSEIRRSVLRIGFKIHLTFSLCATMLNLAANESYKTSNLQRIRIHSPAFGQLTLEIWC